MKILKNFTKNGWEPLYAKQISRALFADKNLSDLKDKEAARNNLEISGDNVHTHYHDDRYLPLIQQLEDKLMNAINNMKIEIENTDMVTKQDCELQNFVNLKNGWYKWTGIIDSINATWIIVKTDSLYTATNMEDPRIVLRSNDLTTWSSPYAYWHA